MSDAVADELEIRQLVARYADAVARRDAKAWGDTWTDDGEWQVLGRSTRGREQVVELWHQLMSGAPHVVQIPHGGIIEVDGDRARARWYITEYLMGGSGGPLFNVGVYHDECVRAPGGWRFARRRFDPLYIGPPDLSAPPRPYPSDVPEI